MSLEENKAIIRNGIEAVNKRNLASLDEFIAPDYVDHTTQLGGLEGVKKFYAVFFNAFPDFHRAIDDIIAEGDRVWVRSTITGTHTGEFRGLAPTGEKITLAPTGKKITIPGVNIYRIVDGKIVETWSVTDLLGFLKQLGIIEYKGFPDEVK